MRRTKKINYAYVNDQMEIVAQAPIYLKSNIIAIVYQHILEGMYNIHGVGGGLWGATGEIGHLIDEHWLVGYTRFNPEQLLEDRLGVKGLAEKQEYFFAFHPDRVDAIGLVKDSVKVSLSLSGNPFSVWLDEKDKQRLTEALEKTSD